MQATSFHSRRHIHIALAVLFALLAAPHSGHAENTLVRLTGEYCYLWQESSQANYSRYMKHTGPHTHSQPGYYPMGQYQGRGCVMPVELAPEQIDHFRSQLGRRDRGGCMDWYSKITVDSTGSNESIFTHWLGFSRTTDGKRLFDRLATISREDRLPVVGVCVKDQVEFNGLSNTDIFSTPHPQIEDRRHGPPAGKVQHPALVPAAGACQ